MTIPRLDILLYAHDGRGFGHISRTVAIAMAVRRLYPYLRVLIVTGCNATQELIHNAPLDWLKLPGYQTEVVDGKSRGIDGSSAFTDKELGLLRAETLRQLVLQYRPRVVLADHTPQGKHRELLPALETTADTDTQWVLGVRSIVGAVQQSGSHLAQQLFKKYYHTLLWYGDSTILSTDQLDMLSEQYSCLAQECGYVSRMQEITGLQCTNNRAGNTAGTIAVPWQGEHGSQILGCITGTLTHIDPAYGEWQIFADLNPKQDSQIISALHKLPHCRLQLPGPAYIDALLRSKTALIYGGYNSLTDILAAGLPAVVLLRAMQDNEQQQHLNLLQQAAGKQLLCIDEQAVTEEIIEVSLQKQMRQPITQPVINLQGAENTARQLVLLTGNVPR